MLDYGVVPLPNETGQLLPRRSRAPAQRPPAPGHRPARRAQLHHRHQPDQLAALVTACLDGSSRRLGAAHASATRTADRCDRSCTGRPSPRWWSPTAIRGPCTVGRTPSTSASGGSVAWPTPSPWVVTAWASSPTSTPPCQRARRPLRRAQRGVHPRGGLRHPLEAPGSPGRTHRGAGSRRLVISSIATVGNYEYGFYWYFYLDGSMQLEIKLTGIMSTQALAPGESLRTPHRLPPVSPPRCTNTCSAPASTSRSVGPSTKSTRSRVRPYPSATPTPGPMPSCPWTPGSSPSRRPAGTSTPRPAATGSSSTRTFTIAWAIPLPTSWCPGPRPPCSPIPESSVGRRAAFARTISGHPLRTGRERGAGDYPNQHAGGDGLPLWTAADRSLIDTSIVAWHTFGVTHVPRPEDWPVMPVEYCGFQLVPVGFFDANPALDVPSSSHCH